ncbi:MAG TPA: condensation domain-containing protein, partial [Vicinamibacterales bacterium]|nr:condensation domain-containing protein [Vicinamibacterales bacterium]
MSFLGLLKECQAKNIKLAVRNGKLLLNDEGGNLSEDLTAALKLHKAELIEWIQGNEEPAPTIRRLENRSNYPLSFSQQRLWFIDQLEGGSAQYNIPVALGLTGRLNQDALQQALDAIVARHAVLRTVFRQIDDEPVQVVRPAVTVLVDRIDLSGLSEAERSQRVQDLTVAEAKKPFDLSRDLMLRCGLIHLGADSHVVLFTMHHIASDGWSMGVLIKEFVALYEAFIEGRPDPLPPLPVQYADFAGWQRQAMQGGLLEAELAHWQARLAGMPTIHSLPLDKPRPAEQSFAANRHSQVIDRAMLDALRHLGRAHGATLFMVLQAAFAALLSRFSGETDVVMGVPNAGRTQKELAPLIGFFINTLIFRTQISEDLQVKELLEQAKHTALDAFAHSNIPFDLLSDALKHERSLAYNPLCQIKFVLQNFESGELELPGLQLEPVGQGDEQVHFDLDLTASESDTGLQLSWTYKDE